MGVMLQLGKLLSKVVAVPVEEHLIPDLANIVGEYASPRWE
jgi:hypothetical protein